LLLQGRRQWELEKKKDPSLFGEFKLNTEDEDLEKGVKEFKDFKDFQRAKQKLEMVHKKIREENNLKKRERRETSPDRLRFEQERIE